MATSESTSAYGSGGASWAGAVLEVSRTGTNVGSNYSTFYYKLYITRTNNISSSASKSYSISVNGSTVASGTTTIGGSGTKIIKEGYIDVYHDTAGNKWLDFSFSQQFDVTLSGVWVGTLSNSGGFWVDQIPRASVPTLNVSTQALGSAITITTNRASDTFTHTLVYVFGNDSQDIATNVGASQSWTLPASLANQIPNASAGIGSIVCHTYSNSGTTYIGTNSVNFTATVPSNATFNPTITSITNSESVTTVSTAVGAYVQGMSKINLGISGASAKYGATISSYSINFDGANYLSSSVTTGVVKGSGALTATATVTDSRGKTASKTLSITVLAYSPPSITALTPIRANSNGTANELGTYINVTRTASSSSLLNGTTEKNVLKYTIKTKLRESSTWTTNKAQTTISGLSLTGSETLAQGTFDVTKSYDIILEVADVFNTTIAIGVISTGQVTMSWGRTGVGVGKVWEQGGLDVNGEIYEDGSKLVDKYTPAGMIQMYAGSTAPTGWLLCQGQAVSRTTYARLFAIIGTTYGTGDGTTTFNLPDLRGRVPVGYNSGETEFNALNKKGGAKTHTLTTNEMPAHKHSALEYGGYYTWGGNPTSDKPPSSTTNMSQYWTQLNSLNTGSQGGGQAHNNLQPYVALNFAIRY